MNTTPKPVAWSHSSLQKFLQCPKRYYEESVIKSVKRKDTEHTIWGNDVHKGLELALKDKTPLPKNMEGFKPVVERFTHIKGTLYTEQKLAINQALRPVEWFAPDVWCRTVIDALWIEDEVAKLADWKSGKRKRGSDQLKLSALITFAHHPKVIRTNTSFVWLQTGKMDVEKFERKDVPILWQSILPDVRRLEYAHRTQTFIPKPSGLCAWCPVTKCHFWKGEQGEEKK